MESAISLLKTMRQKHERNVKYSKIVFAMFLLLLFIDFGIIIALKIETGDIFLWIGIAGLIMAIGFGLKRYYQDLEWIKTIDNFYLETEVRLNKNDKTKI